MTALCASVVFRYRAIVRRLGALMKWAIVSYAASNAAVIARDALDWPRCTFSYVGASNSYRASSSRGGWVLAALFVTIRPVSGKRKCSRIASTSSPGVVI